MTHSEFPWKHSRRHIISRFKLLCFCVPATICLQIQLIVHQPNGLTYSDLIWLLVGRLSMGKLSKIELQVAKIKVAEHLFRTGRQLLLDREIFAEKYEYIYRKLQTRCDQTVSVCYSTETTEEESASCKISVTVRSTHRKHQIIADEDAKITDVSNS